MNIIKNLTNYFNSKAEGNTTEKAPEGICPNCWGKQEWEGEYYKFKKGNNGNPTEDTYNSFVQDVARKLDKISAKGNDYICETCKMDFSNQH